MTKNFLLYFILFVSLGLNLYFYQKIKMENQVVEVVDGDTFQLRSGKRVRLLGVDAPELERCGGYQARQRLTELILGKIVKLKEETTEAYGRSLALVFCEGKFINEIMLKEGWARTDYRKNSKREILTAAFHQAKDNARGIFGSLCRQEETLPPNQNCLIKGNINKETYEKFYHLPSCSHYNQIIIEKDIGERYFCTEEEASAAGFKKAAGCP